MPTSQLYIISPTSIITNEVTDTVSTAARIAGVTGMHGQDDVLFVGISGVPAQVTLRNCNSLLSTSATVVTENKTVSDHKTVSTTASRAVPLYTPISPVRPKRFPKRKFKQFRKTNNYVEEDYLEHIHFLNDIDRIISHFPCGNIFAF